MGGCCGVGVLVVVALKSGQSLQLELSGIHYDSLLLIQYEWYMFILTVFLKQFNKWLIRKMFIRVLN